MGEQIDYQYLTINLLANKSQHDSAVNAWNYIYIEFEVNSEIYDLVFCSSFLIDICAKVWRIFSLGNCVTAHSISRFKVYLKTPKSSFLAKWVAWNWRWSSGSNYYNRISLVRFLLLDRNKAVIKNGFFLHF